MKNQPSPHVAGKVLAISPLRLNSCTNIATGYEVITPDTPTGPTHTS
jgi:hypothetical protein